MASQAEIKLTLDDKQLLGELRKIGGGFDALGHKVDQTASKTGKMAKAVSSGASVFKGLVTFEMVKRAAAFADQTFRAAKDMEGLGAETRAAAADYTAITSSISEAASGIALWVLNLGSGSGLLTTIRDLAAETAESWQFIGTGATAAGQKIAATTGKANGQMVALRTTSNELRAQLAQLNAGVKDKNFAKVLGDEIEASRNKIKELGKEMNLSEGAISRILSGKGVGEGAPAKATPKPANKQVEEIKKVNAALNEAFDGQKKAAEDAYDAGRAASEAAIKRNEEETRLREEAMEAADAQFNHDILLEKKKRDIRKKNHDDDIAMREAEFQASATFFGGMAQLLATQDRKDRARRLAFKAAAIAEALSNTAIGITKAYAMGGPLGFFTGAGIAMAGAAQVETIRAQKFALGGVVQGPEVGDRVPVRANGGEMVLTKEQQAQLFKMANGGGGGATTVTYAPTYGTAPTPFQSKMDMDRFGRMVKGLITNPAFNRTQAAIA